MRFPRGSNATFQAMVEGAAPMDYRWLFNGAEIPGATNASLLITNAQLSHNGTYSVVVSNRTYMLLGRAGFSSGETWRPVVDMLAAPTNRRVEIIQLRHDFTDQQFFRLLTPRSR